MGELLSYDGAWPDGKQVAVSLTFDVDADVGKNRRGLQNRLSSASEARFGARRGLERLLGLLREREIRGTFYVPGEVAQEHPDAVRAISADGHEVAHHGHEHLFNDKISATEQREELERGLEALGPVLEETPRGYRSPGWEMTRESFELLIEHDFSYDSSCMGDDRPYLQRVGEERLVELPVHWSLDDYVFYAFNREEPMPLSGPAEVRRTWLGEFESALAEGRHVTYTMHPEISGRGYRARALGELIDEMRARADVWFATHREVADRVAASLLL
jgi:peptidoglycan/xylan/chitin deacetylase (PgdA/CDA1 family)